MRKLDMVKKLVSRRTVLLHAALWALGLFGVAVWVLGADNRWLALPSVSMASALVLLGIQLQFSADTTQTLKNNSQRRHSALNRMVQRLGGEFIRSNEHSARNAEGVERQLKAASHDLGNVIAKLQLLTEQQQLKSVREALVELSLQGQVLSDQQRFRFAEIIDLYQDQSDRHQAFELRMRRHVAEAMTSKLGSADTEAASHESESPEDAADAHMATSVDVYIDSLAEAIWPSVQNHIWMRDLYARSGSIAPRGFLASPDSMRAGQFLGTSENLLVDWGIDSLTLHLAERRALLGMRTIAIDADDRLADIASQALNGRLQTVSSGTLTVDQVGRELGLLIYEPAGMLISGRLDDTELARLAAVLKDIPLLESVYLTAAPASAGEATLAVLARAGFSLAAVPDGSDIQRVGVDLWQRSI